MDRGIDIPVGVIDDEIGIAPGRSVYAAGQRSKPTAPVAHGHAGIVIERKTRSKDAHGGTEGNRRINSRGEGETKSCPVALGLEIEGLHLGELRCA